MRSSNRAQVSLYYDDHRGDVSRYATTSCSLSFSHISRSRSSRHMQEAEIFPQNEDISKTGRSRLSQRSQPSGRQARSQLQRWCEDAVEETAVPSDVEVAPFSQQEESLILEVGVKDGALGVRTDAKEVEEVLRLRSRCAATDHVRSRLRLFAGNAVVNVPVAVGGSANIISGRVDTSAEANGAPRAMLVQEARRATVSDHDGS